MARVFEGLVYKPHSMDAENSSSCAQMQGELMMQQQQQGESQMMHAMNPHPLLNYDRVIFERTPGFGLFPVDEVMEVLTTCNPGRQTEFTFTGENFNEFESQKMREWISGARMGNN